MKTTPSGRKIILCLSILFGLLVLLLSEQCYLRFDGTEGKRFSVSDASRELFRELTEPLRITYYVSPELSRLYPQTRDIRDFLSAYAAECDYISFEFEDPVAENLEQSLLVQGITGRRIQAVEKNKTEYVTVYSAVLLEYLDKTTVIPFIFTAETLEYELTSRLEQLLSGTTRPVFIVSGNGLDVETDYSYVGPWLASAGFSPEILSAGNFEARLPELLRGTGISTPLVLLGCSHLTAGQTDAVRQFVESGGKAVLFASSLETDIYGSWDVTGPVQADFISVLKSWGLSPQPGLAADISCFRVTLYSDDTVPVYESLNYPLWITSLPRYTTEHSVAEKLQGIQFFWCQPLAAESETVVPLVFSSPEAWCILPDETREQPFVTNPFTVPGSAAAAGYESEQLLLAAEQTIPGGGQFILVGDQYFVATMMLDYTGAAANLDFLVNALLFLSGEQNLLSIRNRTTVSSALYKADETALAAGRTPVLLITGVLCPLLPAGAACTIMLVRKIRQKRNKSRKQPPRSRDRNQSVRSGSSGQEVSE